MSNEKIVELNNYRPHTAGPMLCLGCKHKWVGVMLVGEEVVDCPNCKTSKGVRAGAVNDDGFVMACIKCDNAFIQLVLRGDCEHVDYVLCPACGYSWYLEK